MKPLLYLAFAILVMASCNSMNNTAGNAGDAAKNKAAVQKYFDAINQHNIAPFDSIISNDFNDHTPDPGYGTNAASYKKDYANFIKAFPDIKATVDFVMVDSNKVAAEVNWMGTNTGPMLSEKDSNSMAATNKKMNVDGVDIFTFKDGKATEHWGYYEERKMAQQLGFMPTPGADSTKSGGQ